MRSAPRARCLAGVPVVLLCSALVALATPAMLVGQPGPGTPAGQVAPVAEDFADLVRTLVAERWGLESAEIRLEWPGSRVEPADDPQEVRLLGTGAGGQWTVEVVGRGGRTQHRVRAGTGVNAPVAAREIPRGARLVAEDVVWAESVAWGPPGSSSPRGAVIPPAMGPEGIVGWEALAPLRPGDPLHPPRVRPPEVVRSGEAVRVRLRQGALTLEARAEARGSGGVGDRVRIRLGNGRVVEALIEGPGLVDLSPPAASVTSQVEPGAAPEDEATRDAQEKGKDQEDMHKNSAMWGGFDEDGSGRAGTPLDGSPKDGSPKGREGVGR